MKFDKTIQMLIFNGDPNGTIMCELSNWNGRIYKISRNELNQFSNREDCENTGVYFLFGKNEDNSDTVYIGEAEKMLTRLKQHIKDEAYWNNAIAVISKDNLLNKAHVKYLENKFYLLAQDSGRADIINGNTPTRSSISEYDIAMLQEFINNTKLLVNTLGYKIFDSIEETSVKNNDEEIKFFIKTTRGADATGVIVPDGFAVLKGSKIAIDTTNSFGENLEKHRQSLIDKNIVNPDFEFTKDWVFSSPSTAAAIVMGRRANGLTEWKTETGTILKSIIE